MFTFCTISKLIASLVDDSPPPLALVRGYRVHAGWNEGRLGTDETQRSCMVVEQLTHECLICACYQGRADIA